MTNEIIRNNIERKIFHLIENGKDFKQIADSLDKLIKDFKILLEKDINVIQKDIISQYLEESKIKSTEIKVKIALERDRKITELFN